LASRTRARSSKSGAPARIVGFTQGIRAFTTAPYVFTSFKNAQNYAALREDQTLYILVKVVPGVAVEDVRRALAARLNDVDVMTNAGFSQMTRFYWMFTTGAGVAVLLAALLGLVVGVAVVAQTIYATTMDHIREYGTLKAMGATNRYLYGVIVQQAVISAVIGYVLGMAASWFVVRGSEQGGAAILLPSNGRGHARIDDRDVRRRGPGVHQEGDQTRSRPGVQGLVVKVVGMDDAVSVRHVTKMYAEGKTALRALDGVDFDVEGAAERQASWHRPASMPLPSARVSSRPTRARKIVLDPNRTSRSLRLGSMRRAPSTTRRSFGHPSPASSSASIGTSEKASRPSSTHGLSRSPTGRPCAWCTSMTGIGCR
jgi:hypothetical protein